MKVLFLDYVNPEKEVDSILAYWDDHDMSINSSPACVFAGHGLTCMSLFS